MASAPKSDNLLTVHEVMKMEPGVEFDAITVYKDWSKDGKYDKVYGESQTYLEVYTETSKLQKKSHGCTPVGRETIDPLGKVNIIEHRQAVNKLIMDRLKFREHLDSGQNDLTKARLVMNILTFEKQYAQDLSKAEHRGSIMAAEEFEALYLNEERKELSIIDIGAGTGRAAIELRRRGFSKIDGLDPSEDMLNIAKDMHLYNRYIYAFFTENKLEIENDTYEAIVCVGLICPNHLPHGAIKEMLRILKPDKTMKGGGHFVMVGSEREWKRLPEFSVKMSGLIHDLEKERKLQLVKRIFKEGYMFRGTADNVDAILYVIKKP